MVSPALFLGGAALSAGLNAWGANSANKANAKYMKDALAAYKKLIGEQSVSGKQALGARQSGLEAIQSGFAGALAETSRMGDANEIGLRDQAQVLEGQATQDLINRGMFNPEQSAYNRRGISSDLYRLINQNNATTAAARAGIMQSGALATAGGYGDIASQITQNFGQKAGLAQNMIGLGASQQATSQNYGQDIGWLFAALSQMNLGGGKQPALGGGSQYGAWGMKA
jgi:hypothetical protein